MNPIEKINRDPGMKDAEQNSDSGNKGIKNESLKFKNLEKKLDSIISKKRFFDALKSDVYESAKSEYDDLRSINDWRKKSKNSPAKDFYRMFEEFSSLENETLEVQEKNAMSGLLADRLSMSSRGLSPRAHDLHQAILAKIDGKNYEPKFEITKKKIDDISKENDISYLKNPKITVKNKLDYLSKRFDDYISGANALDRIDEENKNKEEKENQETDKEDNNTPPPAEEESKPSMDEMNRLENGEKAGAIWSITPAYGGYYRQQSFDTWDSQKKAWKQSDYEYKNFNIESRESKNKIEMSAEIRGSAWTRIPIPYTHEISKIEGIDSRFIKTKKDVNGDVLVYLEKDGNIQFSLTESPNKLDTITFKKTSSQNTSERFTDETEKAIEEIKKAKQGNKARAFAVSRYVLSRLKYSNESKYNDIYNSDPNGYCFAIDTHKQADCDVGNTYFAALCQKLGVPARHVVGHMVKGKDENNASAITSGTGHAWSEIWDDEENKWMRIDATPPGDPQLEEQDQQESNEPVPGDYGEQEAIGPSDEELAKLEQELAKVVENLSYTPDERKLSEETGIELKEARDIMREINQAEDTRLKDGRRVVDAMSQMFEMIIESRKHLRQEYTGPLRRQEGGEFIEDVVAHHIGTVANESDPLSRSKEKDHIHEEKVFGGFDVYIIGDKSGSMSDTVDGESKWKTQRRAEYLTLSSLHRFEEKLKKSGVSALKDKSLNVRTEAISFRGGSINDIDTDKPLGEKFESKDKVALWHSLTEQGGGNGDVVSLQIIHAQIKDEIKKIENSGKKDDRLRIVIAMSDGSPDSVSGVHTMAEELGKMNAVVVGIGLTETAKAVEQIYTTKWSHGDYAKDINDLPAIVAKHIISESIKLFPEKSKKQSERTITSLLASFKK